ncbi:hypothetical protein [Metabacillus niabensis]|uniref:SLAC1 family transporter n=1 Tax=Metabacillus niabensis TaxID=324854 RepID=UPI0039A238A5
MKLHAETKNKRALPLIDVSSGSIVMAIGIFLIGAIQQFSFLNQHLSTVLTFSLLCFWFMLVLTFFLSVWREAYRQYLTKHPITFFGVGTWIASTSVIVNLFVLRFPSSLLAIKGLLILNLVLWSFFIVFCMKQLKTIIKNGHIFETHGAILLSTVSTQSIAILMINTDSPFSHTSLIDGFILIGIMFYIISIILLIMRFSIKFRNIHEWKNTDCIIHGAVSITGLSMTLSGHFSSFSLSMIWYAAFSLFVFVEFIEVIRGVKRIKDYGLKKGIFTYHVSQWSRNFTFGMFYLFTLRLLENYSTENTLLFQKLVLYPLGWIVLLLLLIQISIFSYSAFLMKEIQTLAKHSTT